MTMTEGATTTPAAYSPMAWLSFALPPASRDELKDHAHAARISVSELIRRRVLGHPAPKAAVPALNARAYSDLGQVGNNLNQIAKKANESGQFGPGQLPILIKVLTEFKALNADWQASLIGADQRPEEDLE